jgi:serine protease Do
VKACGAVGRGRSGCFRSERQSLSARSCPCPRPRTLLRVLLGVLLLVGLASAVDAREWSWLGVRIRDISEQEMEEIAARHGIREGFGVLIVEIIEGAPASSAGLKNGDIVVAFGERPVTETRILQRLVAAAPTDRESELTVLRAEGRRRVKVRLVSMPRAMVGERVAAEFGFVMREPDGAGEPPSRRPAVAAPAIAGVLKGTAAEKAGLEVGDVILQVNDQPVLTRDAARDALADVPLDRPVRLTVRRGDSRVSVTLPSP